MVSRSLSAAALCSVVVAAVYLKRRLQGNSSLHIDGARTTSRVNDLITQALLNKGDTCECYQQLLQKTSLYLISDPFCQAMLTNLLPEGKDPIVIGFDAEWVYTGPSNRIDVLQLSVGKFNLVFQVHGLRELPPVLCHLLESRRILKVGVGIAEDARRVQACFGITVQGCVELNDIYSRVEVTDTTPFFSLKTLTQQVCGLDLPKDKSLACSDWSVPQLSVEQIIYAASDAYCSLLVFEGLFKRYVEVRHKTITWDYAGVRSLCPGLIDGGRAQSKPRSNEERKTDKNSNDIQQRSEEKQKGGGGPAAPLVPPPTKRLYENCKVYGPDGQLVALTNNKRVQRYLKQGAGVLVDVAPGEPAAIKLFEVPETLALQPESEELQKFYLSNLENTCVVCGANASFRRFHVLPHAFRRHFPNWYFSHRGHDSLLMCEECHLQAEKHTEKLVKIIFHEHGLDDEQAAHRRRVQRRRIFAAPDASSPVPPSDDPNEDDDAQQLAVYNSARILLRAGDKMPTAKKEECLAVLRNYFYPEQGEIKDITQQDIEQAAALYDQKSRGQATQYGVVVTRLLQGGPADNQLPGFCRRFREHFLQTMKPRHLPPHWTVDLPVALEVHRKPNDSHPEKEETLSSSDPRINEENIVH